MAVESAGPESISAMTKEILKKVRQIVPPMLEKFHKGQLGRVGVLGGSADYTGAPYFSAMASAKLGCDMSHVICEPSAAPVIKSYSPNLMVHPILQSTSSVGSNHSPSTATEDDASWHAKPIISFLSRLHVLVIGPGLGRDTLTQRIIALVIQEARHREIPIVMDADALLLVQDQPELIHGYTECILTPNLVEFERLRKALGLRDDVACSDHWDRIADEQEKEKEKEKGLCEQLARALGGVLIIQKGRRDVISNGHVSMVSALEGGRKRSGGQGDTLTGTLGTFLAWRKGYHEGLWDGGIRKENCSSSEDKEDVWYELFKMPAADGAKKKMSRKTTIMLAAWAGSAITRESSKRAFLAKGRSMQASDLTEEVHPSFLDLIGEPDDLSRL
ncbi:hypothetical protein FQN57_006945 [Myotisia sp. PD_48]|nr:hypothetical protein FQN57_006945 [Myotisia sp. PD_48]